MNFWNGTKAARRSSAFEGPCQVRSLVLNGFPAHIISCFHKRPELAILLELLGAGQYLVVSYDGSYLGPLLLFLVLAHLPLKLDRTTTLSFDAELTGLLTK